MSWSVRLFQNNMVGLTFVDILRPTTLQWGVLLANALAWGYGYLYTIAPRKIAVVILPCLLYVFWNAPMNIDMELLFRGAQSAQTQSWTAFLTTLDKHAYINYQPPHLTYWLSKTPILAIQQLTWLPLGVCCIDLLHQLYGKVASLLCATPLFALLIHQPSHDLLLFTALLITLRLHQLEHRALAAISYGVTWWIKPLTLITLPFFVLQLRSYIILSLFLWASYVIWSTQYAFGQLQWAFLMQQLMITALLHKPMATSIAHGVITKPQTLSGGFAYRWHHLTKRAIKAIPFYFFPAYAQKWTFSGLALLGIILIGYGNIKYCLLDLLFLFPIVPQNVSAEIRR